MFQVGVPFGYPKMIHEKMHEALQRLFDRLSLAGLEPDFSSLESIRKSLRGSGIDLHPVRLVKGTIPQTQGLLGGIFLNTDKSAYAFLKSDKGLLGLSGAAQDEVLRNEDIEEYTQAWLLVEKSVQLSAFSPFLIRYKGRFFDLLLAGLLVNLFALVFPLFSSFVYDKVLGNNITETLWALAICIFIVMLIELCVRIVRVNVAERFAVSSETDIDNSIFRRLMDTNVQAMPNIAVLLEKYKQILAYRDFLSSSCLLSLIDIPFVILFLAAIAIAGGPIVLIGLVCSILVVLVSVAQTKPVLAYDNESRRSSEKRFSLLTDLLMSREVVIGSAFRNDMQSKLRQFSVESAVAASKARYWRGLNMSVSNSISMLSFVSVIIAGVYMVEAHQLTSGGLLAVSMLTSRVLSNVSSASSLIVKYKEFQISLEELNKILPHDVPVEKTSYGKLRGQVHFDNVSCTFAKSGAPVLDQINLTIAPGQLVGLAGSPGAGKTTLLRMIAGAVQPTAGRILIDGMPLAAISHEDIAVSMGYKPQDLCLLEGSVEENILAGRTRMPPEEMHRLLSASGLEGSFAQGDLDWMTQIGARGSRISGGQRQLVSLARALMGTPSILLLDEPTNGLDAQLEQHVARQLSKLKGKSTMIVSTHSHSILSVCDRIVVIGKGKIAADGPREKILMSNQA